MRKINSVLESAILQKEALRGARAWRALRQWGEVVGPGLASKSAPDRYERGVVFVAVVGSTWAVELRMRKDQILSRLREISGDSTLFDKLRFGVRTFDYAAIEASHALADVFEEETIDRGSESIREIGERLIKKRQNEGRD